MKLTGSNVNKISEEDLFEIIMNHFKVSKKEITSKKKDKHIVTARHFIAMFLRDVFKKKHIEIANLLGFNDHTAALNAITQGKKKSKGKYIDDYNKISQMIK